MRTLQGLALVWVACWLIELDYPLVLMTLWSSAQSLPRYDFSHVLPYVKKVARHERCS